MIETKREMRKVEGWSEKRDGQKMASSKERKGERDKERKKCE